MAANLSYRFDGHFTIPAPEPRAPQPTESQPATLPPALLTPEDAARYLSIGRSKMFELLRGPDPAIPSFTIGGSRRIRVADLNAYVEGRSR